MNRGFIVLALGLGACATRSAPPSPPPVRDAPVAASSVALAPSEPPARQGSTTRPREGRRIKRMLARVEAARGLSSSRVVPGVALARSELIARVRAHVSRELPAQSIRNEGLALQLFGFIPVDFDYEAAEYRLLEQQLAGYFEPADGTMYMASDLEDEEADATLAHELVHALQDQRWDLESRSKYRPGAGDLSEAVSALAEGDATSAMFDVMIERSAAGRGKTALDIPDALFVEQIREGMNQGPGADAPRVMRSSLAAPYIYGTLFVNALRRRGGWAAVDLAWDSAPTTTEQILHLDKWDAHESPLDVAAPPFATLGPGWTVADEDTEGELGVRITLEQWMAPALAAESAAGWGGDRGVLLANGDRTAFAWRLRYDRETPQGERAGRAYRALTHALTQSLGPPQSTEAAFACYPRSDRGPLAVARAGADLVLVLGPAVTGPSSWASAGNCVLARRWIREIMARVGPG